jgi:hypothetical protein
MTPIEIEGATGSLAAPADWDSEKHGQCATLKIRLWSLDGSMVMSSAWKPSDEELAALNRGEPVILTIWGTQHPPIALGVMGPTA